MFTPLILACTIDGLYCATASNGVLYKTEEECWTDIEYGYKELAKINVIVIEAVCYRWDAPALDKES